MYSLHSKQTLLKQGVQDFGKVPKVDTELGG